MRLCWLSIYVYALVLAQYLCVCACVGSVFCNNSECYLFIIDSKCRFIACKVLLYEFRVTIILVEYRSFDVACQHCDIEFEW